MLIFNALLYISVILRNRLMYSRLSLSQNPRGTLKYFAIYIPDISDLQN